MKKSYTGNIARRLSINLTPADDKRLASIYAQLQVRYGITDKPSVSLLLLSVLKEFVEKDADFIPDLHAELLNASKTKKEGHAHV